MPTNTDHIYKNANEDLGRFLGDLSIPMIICVILTLAQITGAMCHAYPNTSHIGSYLSMTLLPRPWRCIAMIM